jgi:hypothetical protein
MSKRKPPGQPPSQRHLPAPEPRPDPNNRVMAYLSDPANRSQFLAAGVIFGVNEKSGTESLFFGKATLERIIRTGHGKMLGVMRVPLDFDTDEPEALGAACKVLKGSCCYKGQGDNPDDPDDIEPGHN